ncbi:MAG: hypothetical protein JWM86_1316, partial [Thermoleophilia bacterium]|nr:hypothetical protein [Thermoleophilia bacterium]
MQSSLDIESIMSDVFAEHGGAASVESFAERGIGAHHLQVRVCRGIIRRVLPGVYVPGAMPFELDERMRRVCALAWVGTAGWLSHETAAAMHGAWHRRSGQVHVTAWNRERKPPVHWIEVHQTRDAAAGVIELGGMRVSSFTQVAI